MSDKEFGGSAEDVSLPKATVQKILNEILPPPDNPTTTKDFRDSLTDACVEFIQLIASEANDIAEKENKKTIACEHITHALKELEFDEYIPAIMESADEFKRQQANREKKQSKIEQSGMTEEELIAQQQALFRSATDKYKPEDDTAGS
ncbi:MAG: hypothetical protein M1831_007334 [Alyxoria varia]|nr:MAG: hypothetical protein M1831_007334 [Alyxoria varia]